MDVTLLDKIVSMHKQPGDPEFVFDNAPSAKPMAAQYKDWIAAVDAHRKATGATLGVTTAPPESHFLQPKVTGYRQLNDGEVALMNEAKALAEQCGALVEKLRKYRDVLDEPLDQRWISMGASDLQVGFMKLTRGIAQPTTF